MARAKTVVQATKEFWDAGVLYAAGDQVELFADDAQFHIKAGSAVKVKDIAPPPPAPAPKSTVKVAPEVAAEK